MADNIQTKLAAARTRLILERPFIGSLVMHLTFIAAASDTCPTTGIDARALYFNPDYIARLTLAETQFVLAHEALHCALAHFARRSHRVRRRWDVACDHAVNLILVQEGMRAPLGALANPEFVGLTAEEIYPLIPLDTSEAPLDAHLFDARAHEFAGLEHEPSARPASKQFDRTQWQEASPGGADGTNGTGYDWDDAGDAIRKSGPGRAPALPGSDRFDPGALEQLAQRWQSRLASAAQAAMQAGRLSESLRRSLEHLIQPRVPWRALLARFLVSVARDDYDFQRGSRREGAALLPRLHSGAIELVVVIDSSGSISDDEIREFMSEVDALKGQIRATLTLHACDDKLSPEGPWVFSPWDPVTLPRLISGGAGTRFTPVFEWIDRDELRPDLLVYFTDAQGEFPLSAPPYPVIWLVKGRGEVPWGERIQLN